MFCIFTKKNIYILRINYNANGDVKYGMDGNSKEYPTLYYFVEVSNLLNYSFFHPRIIVHSIGFTIFTVHSF